MSCTKRILDVAIANLGCIFILWYFLSLKILIKFISLTDGAENFFANVSIGYAHGMYHLSSSGLKCKVQTKRMIEAKITSQMNHK